MWGHAAKGELPAPLSMTDILIAKPDQHFSPEWNAFVIEDTLKRHEAMVKQKQAEFHEALGERTDAAATYLKHLSSKGTQLERYFGKSELARLRGESIYNQLKRKYHGT